MTCKAKQYSDQMLCECGLAWDVNDPDSPACPAEAKYGGAGGIPQVGVGCDADVFENAVRRVGVIFACKWFGHDAESDFTKETIKTLCERSGIEPP